MEVAHAPDTRAGAPANASRKRPSIKVTKGTTVAGLKLAGGVWLATVGAAAAWQGIITIYGEFIGLYGIAATMAALTTIVTSLGILGMASRRCYRWCRRTGAALRAILKLDEKFDEHRAESRTHWKSTSERFDAGDERMNRIEGRVDNVAGVLDALAKAERAAVRGAIDAVGSEMPPPRDGWRE